MTVNSVRMLVDHGRAVDDADWLVSTDRLAVHLTSRSSVMIVGVRGEVDDPTLPALERALSMSFARRPVRVVVDAMAVSSCSPAGFAALLDAADRADRADVVYAVAGLSEPQQQLLRVGWPHRDSDRLCHATLSDALAGGPPASRDGTHTGGDEAARPGLPVHPSAVIEQAKGVLMARTGCEPEEALTLLFRSVRDDRSLRDVAADLVEATRPAAAGRPSPATAP